MHCDRVSLRNVDRGGARERFRTDHQEGAASIWDARAYRLTLSVLSRVVHAYILSVNTMPAQWPKSWPATLASSRDLAFSSHVSASVSLDGGGGFEGGGTGVTVRSTNASLRFTGALLGWTSSSLEVDDDCGRLLRSERLFRWNGVTGVVLASLDDVDEAFLLQTARPQRASASSVHSRSETNITQARAGGEAHRGGGEEDANRNEGRSFLIDARA
jgi:hypothetical protein